MYTAVLMAGPLHSSTSRLNLSHVCHRTPSTTQRIPQTVVTSSRQVVECKPLSGPHFSAPPEPSFSPNHPTYPKETTYVEPR